MENNETDHKKLLQSRIEELGSAIINIFDGKTYVEGFNGEEMLCLWNKGVNCRQSQGLYYIEAEDELDYSRSKDNALIILKRDNLEKCRFQFVPFFKGIVKYNLIENLNSRLEQKFKSNNKYYTRLFTMRKCKYTNQYNVVYFEDAEEGGKNKISMIFKDFKEADILFKRTFNNYKLYSLDNKRISEGFEYFKK